MKPQEFIKKYAGQYFRIDKAYRKFYYYCSLANNRGLDKVKEIVEKAYVNNYLYEINLKFSNQMSEIAPIWKIDNVPMQKDFYYNEIRKNKNKTVVIISDALRYEAAEDLMQEIKSNYSIKADAELEYMLGSIPSYTELGMAALLPHNELTMNDKGNVFADGIITNAQNRGKILALHNEKTKAMNFEDLDNLSREELREIFSGIETAYIYHDKIDKAGHDKNDVFLQYKEL